MSDLKSTQSGIARSRRKKNVLVRLVCMQSL